MENKARIRINLNLREFEIEGSEDFINSHSSKIENFLEILKNTPPPVQSFSANPVQVPQMEQTGLSQGVSSNLTLPDTFGEYFHKLPKASKDADKILLAANFAQASSSDYSFSTGDATKLLLAQGVKLSNSTVFLKQNLKAKYLIQLSKGKFRVSREGVEYIQQLISGIKN